MLDSLNYIPNYSCSTQSIDKPSQSQSPKKLPYRFLSLSVKHGQEESHTTNDQPMNSSTYTQPNYSYLVKYEYLSHYYNEFNLIQPMLSASTNQSQCLQFLNNKFELVLMNVLDFFSSFKSSSSQISQINMVGKDVWFYSIKGSPSCLSYLVFLYRIEAMTTLNSSIRRSLERKELGCIMIFMCLLYVKYCYCELHSSIACVCHCTFHQIFGNKLMLLLRRKSIWMECY